MKTLSLLQPEASQARTSCSEPCAKKPRRGEGEDRLNMIQSGMDGVQFQEGEKNGGRVQSLCFIWSERDTCIIAALQE